MKVYAINSALGSGSVKLVSAEKNNNYISATAKEDSFQKSVPDIRTLTFGGFKIHIVDGGLHSSTMTHFARGIVKELDDTVDVVLHKVDTHPRYSGLKQMTSVRDQLKLLNDKEIAKPGEYVAITGSAQVYLSFLEERMGLKPKTLRPEIIKSYKNDILKFLSDEYDARSIDPKGQGFEAVSDVIKEINKLEKRGVHVYLPAGHPIEFDLKYRAGLADAKDDLYNYIFTRGREGGDKILPIINEIKSENVYKFNLLALSDAKVVNVRDLSGEKDYIFAAYDNCVNDGARGVYNFYPVRNALGKVLGYSFTDRKTIHYPYNEYPDNAGIENILKFVGRSHKDFADQYEGNIVHIMKSLLEWEEPVNTLPDILYPLNIYPKKFPQRNDYLKKGTLFTKDEKLFFDVNDKGEYIFRRCDCEGSGRPSVVSMWGSCFSTLAAIKRDIASIIKCCRRKPNSEDLGRIRELRNNAEMVLKKTGDDRAFEIELNKLLKAIKPFEDDPKTFEDNLWCHDRLYKSLRFQKKMGPAEWVANSMINLRCRILLHHFKEEEYITDLGTLRSGEYWDYPRKDIERLTKEKDKIADWFYEVKQLCHEKQNTRAEKISEWASRMIRNCHVTYAEPVIKSRANGHIDIKEFYDEYYSKSWHQGL